jgi:hypothetical protein
MPVDAVIKPHLNRCTENSTNEILGDKGILDLTEIAVYAVAKNGVLSEILTKEEVGNLLLQRQ